MQFLILAGLLQTAHAGLVQICNTDYIRSVLPPPGLVPGVNTLPDSVVAHAVTNYSIASSALTPGGDGLSFCNVTFAYNHTGLQGETKLRFWLPSPEQFQNRFLVTGGGGYAITSGERYISNGLVYGAAAATTDGGFGSWDAELTDVLLRADGVVNNEMLNAFGFKAIREMAVLGKEFVQKFYSASKVYTYYEGCSEGGREGWSQVQRYGDQFDGVAVGAPAFRQVFLQVMHLFESVVQAEHDYYPPVCELSRITQDAIEACDLLDGRADGVVSRTDLCKMHYNASTSVGKSFSCAATSGQSQSGAPANPAASGQVSSKAAQIATDIWRGPFDSSGKQIYIPYPPSAAFADGATVFNETTNSYQPYLAEFGTEFVNMFLHEKKTEATETLLGVDFGTVTPETLRDWVLEGVQKFGETIQTTWPDLHPFRHHGGKIIHYHGESDPAIPAGSSVLYHDAVRRSMYPAESFNASHAHLAEWYRLFLVPGAGHCGPNADQANGPFPQTLLGSLIGWVERGVTPVQLDGTVLGSGDGQKICSFPLRPVWTNNGTSMDCVYDQASIDSWFPKLDGFPLPVY